MTLLMLQDMPLSVRAFFKESQIYTSNVEERVYEYRGEQGLVVNVEV